MCGRNSEILRVPSPKQHRCQRLLSSRSKSNKPSKKRSETIMSNESLKIVLARGRSTGPKGSLVGRVTRGAADRKSSLARQAIFERRRCSPANNRSHGCDFALRTTQEDTKGPGSLVHFRFLESFLHFLISGTTFLARWAESGTFNCLSCGSSRNCTCRGHFDH